MRRKGRGAVATGVTSRPRHKGQPATNERGGLITPRNDSTTGV